MPQIMPMHGADRSAPLAAAHALPKDQPMVLLYSAMHSQGSGGVSYLASDPEQVLEGSDISPLRAALMQPGGGRWFGYLGYEIASDRLSMAPASPTHCPMPDFWMMKPARLQCWHHAEDAMPKAAPEKADISLPPARVVSSISQQDYCNAIKVTLEQIRAGAFYQANLTRKIYAAYDVPPDGLMLFEQLCRLSPAPFAAYIRTPHGEVISSSPEGFLQVNSTGQMRTRPMKGTAPRGNTPSEDAALYEALRHSAKDKAENLMIVDLMRNDLSQVCEPSSVKVEALQEVHRFAAYHQMISTVIGQRRKDVGALDAVLACLPPGSMTGAPKQAAMAWCASQEKMKRGVYSGVLGWLDSNGSCDFSVVIRTMILQGNRCEFQVGGGIVVDSDPQAEWQETQVKASAMLRTLSGHE